MKGGRTAIRCRDRAADHIRDRLPQRQRFLCAGCGYIDRGDLRANWVRIAARFPIRVLLDTPPGDLMRYGATAVIVIEK